MGERNFVSDENESVNVMMQQGNQEEWAAQFDLMLTPILKPGSEILFTIIFCLTKVFNKRSYIICACGGLKWMLACNGKI